MQRLNRALDPSPEQQQQIDLLNRRFNNLTELPQFLGYDLTNGRVIPEILKLKQCYPNFVAVIFQTTGRDPAVDGVIRIEAIKMKQDQISHFDRWIYFENVPQLSLLDLNIDRTTFLQQGIPLAAGVQQFTDFAEQLPLILFNDKGKKFIKFDAFQTFDLQTFYKHLVRGLPSQQYRLWYYAKYLKLLPQTQANREPDVERLFKVAFKTLFLIKDLDVQPFNYLSEIQDHIVIKSILPVRQEDTSWLQVQLTYCTHPADYFLVWKNHKFQASVPHLRPPLVAAMFSPHLLQRCNKEVCIKAKVQKLSDILDPNFPF